MDFYLILGVDRAAALAEIKRAYRRLARRYHPDINPGDRTAAAQFRQISAAYEILSDPDRRRRYDTAGETGADVGDPTFGFEGFDFSVSANGTMASTFGDLFADVLQQYAGGAPVGAPVRGTDLHHTITIGFEDAFRGGQHTVTVTRQEHCRTCKGVGRLHVAESGCLHCDASGIVKSARGHMVFSKPCAHCGGSGRQRQTRCPTCGGSQVETRTEPLAITSPAGLADQSRVRVPGKGNVGRNGGENGDLYITVRVDPHPRLHREGDDLHLVVPVAVHEAALGTKFEVLSLDGPVRVRVPPGTQSGQRFRLRDRGVPSPRDGRRGDLVIEVRLVLPKLLDERSKELLREFGRINGEDVRAESAKTKDTRDIDQAVDSGWRRVAPVDSVLRPMKKPGKAYYMISAVAQKYQIHPQTLRLYEREGLLKPSRTDGNTRLYSEDDLEQLETILSLTRDLGVNLAGVEIILNMRRKIEAMQGEVNEFMEYVKKELVRGIDDWEQRLSTALVKSSPTDLVRAASATEPSAPHADGGQKKTS